MPLCGKSPLDAFSLYSSVMEFFLPVEAALAVAKAIATSRSVTLALEFFLVDGCDTGDSPGMTNGSWMSEVKVRKAISNIVVSEIGMSTVVSV